MSYPDVRMVQALCGNLMMAFDSAKVNFLEARKALQIFCRLLKKLESLDKNNENDEHVVVLKRMMSHIKESVSFLRTKLTKNSDTTEEGFKLLQNRLTKIEDLIEVLSTKKRKYNDEYICYKRLRTQVHSNMSVAKDDRLLGRKSKVESLEKMIESMDLSISNVIMEKDALVATCSKMEDFLESTKGFIEQLKNKRIVVSKQGALLTKWCANIQMKHTALLDIRNHIVDSNTIAFEFVNPAEYPSSAPRLILTAKFMSCEQGPNPYALMHAVVNHDSLDVIMALEYAIQRNDLPYLLTKVQASWKKHFLLLQEIVSLREKYPIDWQVDEDKLCVLLGDHVNVSCTFHVPKDYPTSGKVTIHKIEGAPTNANIEDMKPNDVQAPSLTTWIEHLAERFNNV